MKPKAIRSILALVLLVGLVLAVAPAVFAAVTISVDKTNASCVIGTGQADPYSVVYCAIEDAVFDAVADDTINVAAGTYAVLAQMNFNKTGITLTGAGSTSTIVQVSGAGRFYVTANGVTIQGFQIEETDKATPGIIYIGANNVSVKSNLIFGKYVFGDGETSRAFEVAYGSSGLLIEGNTIHSLRQPGYLNGSLASPTTGSIKDNSVYNTRGWVLAGANMTFTGSTWGTGNIFDIVILDMTDPSYYPNIVAVSNANNGAVVEDQRPILDVLSVVYVDDSAAPGGNGGQLAPYQTITPAVTRVVAGGTIHVAAGTYAGNITINKSLTLLGDPGDASPGPGANAPIVDGGSAPGDAILIANGVSNVTIQGFEIRNFTSNDTGIGNGVSAWVGSTSNITVQDNYFHNLGYNGVLVGNDKNSDPSKWGDHTNWTIKGNILETFEAYGFELTNASNSSIENNIIHSNATWNLASTCIMVDARRSESGIVIKGNRIDGEVWPGYPAVYVFANSFETPNVNLNDVLIEANIVSTTSSTATAQVMVYNYAGTGTVTGVRVHGNSLSSFKTNTPALIDAEHNYWGTVVFSEIAPKISGSVDWSPWCNSDFTACTYTWPVHNITQGTDHPTIQSAVDAASWGDTIQIDAGTFAEHVTNGNVAGNTAADYGKQLNLVGTTDVDGKPLTKIQGSYSTNMTGPDDGWRIENIEFVVTTKDLLTVKDAYRPIIKNCIFDGSGLFLSGKNGVAHYSGPNGNTDWTIEGSTFRNGLYVGISSRITNLTVKDCIFENVKSGINQQGGNNLVVQDTDFSVEAQAVGSDTYGIRFASDATQNMTITGGSISVDKNGLVADAGTYHSAIIVRAAASGTLKANGISINGEVVNLSATSLDATCNYWQTLVASEIGAKITGPVVWSPWSNSDLSACATAFPVHNRTKGTDFPTIQAAIDDANPGDVIQPDAGTYDTAATIVVNKALTLQGPTSGVALLRGTDSAVVTVLEIAASNVMVQGLEFTHSALLDKASAPTPWTELGNSLVRIPASAGLTGVVFTDNKIYVPAQAGAMSTWNGVAFTVGSDGATGLTISGNTIHNTRNGLVLQYRNTASITGNVIYDTKGGVMNYTSSLADAGNRTMSGNSWGTTHNEWDFVWNSGSYYAVPDRQPRVMGLSAANNGAYVLDLVSTDAAAVTALTGNRSHIFVNAASTFGVMHRSQGNINEPFNTLALGWQAVIPGGTIYVVGAGSYSVPAGTYPGGVVVMATGVTIDLNGATVGPGSPAFTITGDDVTLMNGILDGTDDPASPGVLVLAGADNLIVDGMEIRKWADGIQVQGGHISFKLVNSWLHLNTDAGLQLDSGVSFGGVVTVQGNLFKQNGGNGVQNDDTLYTLDATYNSWGDLNGPTGTNGDGVDSSGVTYAPWTFAELYLDMVPDTDASFVQVNETNPFSVKLKADAAKLYGLSFTIKWDTTNLTYGGIAWSTPWASSKCFALPGLATDEIGYSCNLEAGPGTPDPEWDATAGTIATLTFTAKTMPPANGPWDSFFDIYHEEADTSANAVGGVKVFVNNAGYDTPGPRGDIADTNDGHVIIDGLANYTGFVDLQGRPNDSGAAVEVYNQATKSGATKLAQGTSGSGGGYTTAYVSPYQLVINNTYWLYVDRALYLPTTAVAQSSYGQNHILDVRPLTGLNTVTLLGGDATNNNEIDINDASCIGNDYGKTSGFTECGGTGSGGSSDVNGNSKVDNSDLTLMGGNFYKLFSPWPTP